MTAPAAVFGGIPERRELVVSLYCECGVAFEGGSRVEVERLHEQHRAEMRKPGVHEAVPF